MRGNDHSLQWGFVEKIEGAQVYRKSMPRPLPLKEPSGQRSFWKFLENPGGKLPQLVRGGVILHGIGTRTDYLNIPGYISQQRVHAVKRGALGRRPSPSADRQLYAQHGTELRDLEVLLRQGERDALGERAALSAEQQDLLAAGTLSPPAVRRSLGTTMRRVMLASPLTVA